MQLIPLISIIFLTGLVSSVLTVFLVRKFLLKAFISGLVDILQKGQSVELVTENSLPSISKHTEHTEPKDQQKNSKLKPSRNRFFRLASVLGNRLLRGILFVPRLVIRVTSALFEYITLVLGILIQLPLWFILWAYHDLKRLAYVRLFFYKTHTGIKNIIQRIKCNTVQAFKKSEKSEIAKRNIYNQTQIENNTKEVPKTLVAAKVGKHYFIFELLVSLIFAVLIFAPFISKTQQTAPGYFFFYHIAVLIFGGYILLSHHSPRVFWAIGIMEWSSVFLWFFNWYGGTYIFLATVFLTAFVAIYGVSSYIWYGLQQRDYAYIEYALFILHPFLYMSAIYLLLIGGYAKVVSIIFILLASLYAYFASTLYNKNITKNILYICLCISTIAIVSAITSILSGLALVLVLAVFGVLILQLGAYYQLKITAPIIPALVYLVVSTLSLINPSNPAAPFLNERFLSYVITTGTLFFIAGYIRRLYRSNTFLVYKYIYWGCILVASMLFATAVTLELADNKVVSTSTTETIKLAFYLIYGIVLYVCGSRLRLRSLHVSAIIIAVYTIGYALKTFF